MMTVRTLSACLLACAAVGSAYAQQAQGAETTAAASPVVEAGQPAPASAPVPQSAAQPALTPTPIAGPATAPTPAAASAATSPTPAPTAVPMTTVTTTTTTTGPSVATPQPAAAAAPVKPSRKARPAVAKPIAKPVAAAPTKASERPVAAGTAIRGRVNLTPGPRQDVAGGEVAQTVIYFLPKAGSARPTPARYSVRTHSKGFEPNLLVVPVGSAVAFPNRDVVLHNVFSKTTGSTFDLGTYAAGQTRTHRFQGVGLVTVNCNVHRGMRANVLVLETPYYTRPQADGSFNLGGLPSGPGTLVIWHPRAPAQSVAVAGPLKAPVVRTLVATRPRIAVMP